MAYLGTKLYKFEPRSFVDSLVIIDTEIGSGAAVAKGSVVTVHYTGALAKNGIIFQSSHDSGRPLKIALSEAIEGWSLGILGMKVGGSRRLVIPANLAYGSDSPAKNIPANSDLVFDIDLLGVSNGT